MWDYVLVGATIFGSIVTIGAWLNGRATRKYVGRLILEESKSTRELVEEVSKRMEKLLEEHGKILKKLSEQHLTMIKILKSSKS